MNVEQLKSLVTLAKIYGPWVFIAATAFALAKQLITKGFSVRVDVGRRRLR
jgi:hypothetical protein